MNYTKIRRGKRADLGDTSFRSSWEANVARWLCYLQREGHLLAWGYEFRTFVFPGVTRGAVQYTPDFMLRYGDGSHEWLEVKGREEGSDRTKWKRMRQHYPEERLVVLGAVEYKQLVKEHGGLPHWER
jgi:hypothetical protein